MRGSAFFNTRPNPTRQEIQPAPNPNPTRPEEQKNKASERIAMEPV